VTTRYPPRGGIPPSNGEPHTADRPRLGQWPGPRRASYLPDALRLFFSNTFDVLTFPYAEALKAWKEAAEVRGRYKKTFK
jgi:hypothetical protein